MQCNDDLLSGEVVRAKNVVRARNEQSDSKEKRRRGMKKAGEGQDPDVNKYLDCSTPI